MNVSQVYGASTPRYRVWCVSDELVEGTGADAGTYTFVDTTTAGFLGTGTEIIVIDKPGKMLFWDAENGVAYDWTAESGS